LGLRDITPLPVRWIRCLMRSMVRTGSATSSFSLCNTSCSSTPTAPPPDSRLCSSEWTWSRTWRPPRHCSRCVLKWISDLYLDGTLPLVRPVRTAVTRNLRADRLVTVAGRNHTTRPLLNRPGGGQRHAMPAEDVHHFRA